MWQVSVHIQLATLLSVFPCKILIHHCLPLILLMWDVCTILGNTKLEALDTVYIVRVQTKASYLTDYFQVSSLPSMLHFLIFLLTSSDVIYSLHLLTMTCVWKHVLKLCSVCVCVCVCTRVCVHVCVCVSVCVYACTRERERERGGVKYTTIRYKL